jgi:nitroimidazol reductase NimA-like FMN-containing flavoprotein (pyridoxamine 5'-phosphate oxidase superfamily)
LIGPVNEDVLMPLSTGHDAAAGDLVELDRADCLHLLATSAVGRVVFTESALPAAQPVNYLLDDEEVVFRTEKGSRLAAATRQHVVAFQVDRIDEAARSGWSVLGVGEAYEVVDPVRLAELADRLPPPWVPGHDQHTISIPLQRLTGRRIDRA